MNDSTKTRGSDRSVPPWAAGVIDALARDRPSVVTAATLETYLAEVGSERRPAQVASDLQQLGWLRTLHVRGAWAFVPPGESLASDPYLDLRGWQARGSDVVLALAGEAASWHLGYLQRPFDGPVMIWLPRGDRVVHGLRRHLRVFRSTWSAADVRRLSPTAKLLRSRGLDLTGWASGLPAFGPEAILAQLAQRPGSFQAWADLVSQLGQLGQDCDPARVIDLLDGQSASAWQRAGYLLDRAGHPEKAALLMEGRPTRSTPVVQFGAGPDSFWSREFNVDDHLIAPLQQTLGKA